LLRAGPPWEGDVAFCTCKWLCTGEGVRVIRLFSLISLVGLLLGRSYEPAEKTSMASTLVLTIIGPDQPGLVEAVSQAVADHGGSWESSRMARLAGQFAGILEVRVPSARLGALRASLEDLEPRGLRVVAEEAGAEVESAPHRALRLDLIGHDRPGIIREVSSALAAAGVNVVELSTECSSAPMSGEMLFSASALLHQPQGQSVDELHETLEKIAGELMVDITLDESEG